MGTILGNRYELLEKIGEGGMAEVYKAKCNLLNRYVAVKILKDEFSNDKDFVEKFKREATSAASISASNIVNIYDVGSDGNTNYIVMEYVDGKTLKDYITYKGRLDYKEVIDIGIQISKALSCAHKNNIVHRDIKPQNILIAEDGTIKVTDFGIAKVSHSVTITNTNKILGSAHYFSPEQAKGSIVDLRTDIYSFGIVLYEMLTGRVPYDAESPVTVALKHIQEPLIPPKKIISSIPESLNNLILKALEKDPINRYQTANEILKDLEKIKQDPDSLINNKTLVDDSTRIMSPLIINEDDEEDDVKDSVMSKKKKIILIVSVILIFAVMGGVLGTILAKSRNSNTEPNSASSSTIEVPDIIGLTASKAKEKVENAGLKFVNLDKNSKDDDKVFKCSPLPGTKVPANSEVRVIFSSDTDKMVVPDVTGLNVNSAKEFIKNCDLQVGNIEYSNNDEVPKDIVISQTPQPDSPATKDTKVNIVVSKGFDGKEVPDLSGKTITEAKAIIPAFGFKVGNVVPVSTNDKDKDGLVFNQIPAAKSKSKIGSSVDLNYYKYEEVAP